MRPSREELDDLYNKQGLNTYQIADMFGCWQQTVSKWLAKEGLNHQSKRPTRDKLNTMYTIENMTCRQIATEIGVSPSGVKKWLKEYGIERRPSHNSPDYHGKEPPSRDVLYQLVHVEHKAYHEIGILYDVDKTMITRWLKKYDIPRPTAWDTRDRDNPRTKPSREELSALYDSGLSLTAIGEMFGYSYGAMGDLCRKYGIEVHPDGWDGGKRYLCQDGHLVRSVYEQRVDNWLFAHNIAHVYEPHLPWHSYFDSDFLANGWYIEVWGVTNNETYKRRSEQKRQLYQQYNAPLIELPYYFFAERYRATLERRLSKCLTKPML